MNRCVSFLLDCVHFQFMFMCALLFRWSFLFPNGNGQVITSMDSKKNNVEKCKLFGFKSFFVICVPFEIASLFSEFL